MVYKLLTALILSLLITLAFGYIVISIFRKKHINQSILHYVDNHNAKAGTPTMGGIMFILPTAVITLIFAGIKNQFALISVGVMLAYGLIGFLDDYIKFRNKRNLGLKAYQKIIAQSGIAVIMTIYCYMSRYVGSSVIIPFTDIVVNMQWWYIPLCFIIYIATTNAVNLTDGLDGLAGSCSVVGYVILGVIAMVMTAGYDKSGDTLFVNQYMGLLYFIVSLIGSVIGFLVYNSHPAKIFMGDTGSLALGGSLATIALLLRNPLIILIVGIMFVVTSISVIIQVIYFKITHGKRIFIMSPLHHHLQYKGLKESKIVAIYSIIGVVFGIIALLSISY